MEQYCNNNDNNNDECDDEYDEPIISASEGLSKETLEMLNSLGLNNSNKNMNFMNNGDPQRLDIQDLEVTNPINALSVLKDQGVVRLSNILSPELCKRCVITVLKTLSKAIDMGTDHYDSTICNGFGNVDAKYKRWDMYVDNNDDVIAESYTNMFENKDSVLNVLFANLFDGQDAEVHEFGCLISKDGAKSQRVHSDTTYQSTCPLYTVFIAIQDITQALGPTIFIKGSNTSLAHHDLRHKRNNFLNESEYHQAVLSIGDAVIMDSRNLHCGAENSLGDRCLLYFTLLNPNTSNMGGGSKHDHVHLTLHSLSSI